MSLTPIKVFCLIILFCSCGQLTTVQTGNPVVLMDKAKNVHVSSLLCNPDQCLTQNSETGVHHFLVRRLNSFLQFNYKSTILSGEAADKTELHFVFVSAYEHKIDNSRPRNIYLIVYDSNKKELAQFGIAEHFSSPLHQTYMQLSQVEQRFDQFLHSTFTKPHFLANADNQ